MMNETTHFLLGMLLPLCAFIVALIILARICRQRDKAYGSIEILQGQLKAADEHWREEVNLWAGRANNQKAQYKMQMADLREHPEKIKSVQKAVLAKETLKQDILAVLSKY